MQTLPKPILEVKNLSKKFRIVHDSPPYLSLRDQIGNLFSKRSKEDFWALEDVSFDVSPGESIGIIGKNGAGKSTLLKILSRITPPTKGRIISRGRIASLLEVGTGFHPELTGKENIFLNGSILGMKRTEIQSKYSEIIGFSGVEKFIDTPLKHYSSGMQLRLAFAVAAFLEPEVLVIDEVLAVGDAEFQKKCLNKMEEVSKSGRTVLFVSHNMNAVRNLCSRGIVLSNGRVVSDGEINNAVDQYLSMVFSSATMTTPVFTFKEASSKPFWIDRITVKVNEENNFLLKTGDALSFHLNIGTKKAITEPRIGFVIKNQEGVSILHANNHYQTSSISPTGNSNSIQVLCALGAVPLIAGNYYVTFYLGDETQDYQVLENAANFTVEDKDIWGKGKTPPHVSLLWWNTRFNITR